PSRSCCGRATATKFTDELRWNLIQKARGHAGFGQVGAVAPAVDGAAEDESIHRTSHAHITQAAFFFDIVGLEQRARMGEKAFFHAAEKDERELEALCGVE